MKVSPRCKPELVVESLRELITLAGRELQLRTGVVSRDELFLDEASVERMLRKNDIVLSARAGVSARAKSTLYKRKSRDAERVFGSVWLSQLPRSNWLNRLSHYADH